MDHPGQIGRYETIRLLGRGGMGAVYLARDPLIDRLVAIKVLAPGFDAAARSRFAREARSAGRLQHENIATIFDVGEHEDAPFIAMEYVSGDTLGALIRGRSILDLTETLRLIEEACAGLAFAHRAGIVHLDVKPENLIRRDDGRLKVLDFGIARIISGEQTHTRQLMGTLRYMSPEQLNDGALDLRADVFALGCVLYEALARKPAHTGQLSEIVARIEGREVTPLPEIVPGVHPELVRMTRRAMAHDPADRYQDLETLRQELAGLRREFEAGALSPTTIVPAAHGTGTAAFRPATPVAAGAEARSGLRRIVRWAAPIAIALTAVGAVWWQVTRSNAPSRDAGNLAPAPPAASAPAPSPPPVEVPATRPAGERLDARDDAQEIAAGRSALIGADRATTLKLLRERPALAASVMAEVTASARGAAEQAQKAADAKGLTAAGSRNYRRGLVAIARARKLSDSGQAVDGLSAYWQATDLFAGAEFDAKAAATSAAGEKPATPAPPVVTAPDPGPTAAGPAIASPSVPANPPPPTPPPSAPATRPAETAEADSKPLEPMTRPGIAPEVRTTATADQGVRAALGAYAAAYEQRDIAALRRVFPSLSAEQASALARTFANATSYRLQVAALDIQITGASALATCTITHELVPRVGSPSRNVANTRFQLKLGGDGWVIDRVEASARR